MREQPTKPQQQSRASERDLPLLRLIGEQCAVTLPQLARLMGRTVHAARWLRSRWQRAGWVEGRVLLVGQPVFIWLTGHGQRVADLDFRVWRPKTIGRLPHIAAVTEARLEVTRKRPEAAWVSERELCREAALAGTWQQHMPDAEVILDGRTAAIEVELTPKQRRRTERIASDLLRRYDAVWYFAAPQAKRQLEALAEKNGWRRIQVLALPDPGRPR